MKQFLGSLIIAGLSLLAFPPLLQAQANLLLKEDFEWGLSADWQNPPTIEILEEDLGQGKVNHFARLTSSDRQARMLATPGHEDWRNYDFNFRFRVGKVPGGAEAATKSFLMFLWRVCPAPENRFRSLQAYMAMSHSGDLTLYGPLFPSEEQNFPMETVEINPFSNLTIPLDTDWHTMKVEVRGDDVSIYCDGHLVSKGSDSRAPHGGIALGINNADVAESVDLFGHVDVDDITVAEVK